jgi:hypothetical protein
MFKSQTGDKTRTRKALVEIKDKILKEANIIICTLNFSGNPTLDSLINNLSVVIIDEV